MYACAQVYGEIYFSFKSPKTRETSLQPFKFAFLFVMMHFHDAHLSEAIILTCDIKDG